MVGMSRKERAGIESMASMIVRTEVKAAVKGEVIVE